MRILICLALLACGDPDRTVDPDPWDAPEDSDTDGSDTDTDDTDTGDTDDPVDTCAPMRPYADCTSTAVTTFPASGLEQHSSSVYDSRGRLIELLTEPPGDVPSSLQTWQYNNNLLLISQRWSDDVLQDEFRYRYEDGFLIEIRYVLLGGEASTASVAFTADSQGRVATTRYDLDGDGVFERDCTHTWSAGSTQVSCTDGTGYRLLLSDRGLVTTRYDERDGDSEPWQVTSYTWRQDCQLSAYDLTYAEPRGSWAGAEATYTFADDRRVGMALANRTPEGDLELTMTEATTYDCP